MFLFVSPAIAFCTVNPDLASIFNITTALGAKKKPEFLTAFVPPSNFFFHIYAATSTFHGNFALVIFIGRKFQNLKCLGKHRRTGNFWTEGAVDHLPKKLSQVAQIFTKQSSKKETRAIPCNNVGHTGI